jgi:hypothetical protein
LSPNEKGEWHRRYSSKRYIQEAGDLLGADLVILNFGQHLSGIICFYGDDWGEPDFTPLVLENPRWSGKGELNFEVIYDGKSAKYSLAISGHSAKLARTDLADQPPGEHMLLILQRDLFPLSK